MHNENNTSLSIISSREHLKIRRQGILIALGWSLLILGLLVWSLIIEHNEMRHLALYQARTLLDRDWATQLQHIERTQKSVEERGTGSGSTEKIIPWETGVRNPDRFSPHHLITQKGETQGTNDPYFKLLRSRPLNPANAPNDWETDVLNSFRQGQTEAKMFGRFNGSTRLVVMRPVEMTPSCLACHNSSKGEAAAFLVSIPLSPLWKEARKNLFITIGTHFVLWLGGLLGIWIGYRHMQRRIEEWRRSEQIQSALYQVNSAANASSSLEEYLKTIHQRLGAVIDTSNFYVTLYDQERDEYSFPFHVDEHDTVTEDHRARLPKSLTDYVRRTGRPLLVDREKDRELIDMGEVELVGTPAASWLGVPLVTSEGVMGVVVVQSYHEANVYSEQDLELLQFVSGHIAQIIERKRAEEDLRRSKQRLLLHAQQTPLAYIEWSTELEVLVWNPAAEKIFGFNDEEVLGRRAFDLIIPDDAQEEVRQVVRSLLQGEGGTHNVNENVTKDGRTILCEWYNTPLVDERGNVIGLASLAQDLTEKKKAEEEKRRLEAQVQHAQKLESLGLLAGGIAHDFNNLLMAILGNADLALLELDRFSSARGCIDEIAKTARTAADLCNQMLAYSGKSRFNISALDLSEIVKDMANMIEVSTSKKAILKYDLPENLPVIEGDASQIRQVILNLVTNASEAIGDLSGSISISTGVRDCKRDYLMDSFVVDNPKEGPYTFIEVADSGCGIDEDTMNRLFDPFFTTKFTGRGLGLSAVLGIVKGLSGAIKVTSQSGKGTIFTVLFPVAEHQKSCRTSKPSSDQISTNFSGTLLIADDEESIRLVGKRLLERLGFNVLTADNGSRALEIYREKANQIDCTILDMTMPELDGKQTFRQIRKIRPDAHIILSSGYTEQEVAQNLIEEGLSGFIQKPYRLSSLSAKLAEIIQPRKGNGTRGGYLAQ